MVRKKFRTIQRDRINIALSSGLNGALYFVEMAADGGLSDYSTNKAGGWCEFILDCSQH